MAGRQFAAGDQVMYLRNDRRLAVRNGTVGTVTSIEGGGVALADGTHLPAAYLEEGHLTHSYASTVHKSQGATVDRAFLLGSDQLYREAGYVGLSRARLSSELFAVDPDPSLEMGDRLGQLVRGLSTSRAQQLALFQLPTSREPAAAVVPVSAARAFLADPPSWAIEALGPPRVTGDDRPRWAERVAQLATYRDAYHVTDQTDALGPRPADQMQRRRGKWPSSRYSTADGPSRSKGDLLDEPASTRP